MSQILAIAVKDLRLLLRDYGGMFFVLVFPLIMALLFGAIFGGSGGGGARSMKIGIPDQPRSAEKAFYDELAKSEVLDIAVLPADSAKALVSAGKLIAFVGYTDTSSAKFSIFSPSRPSIEVWIDPSRKAESGYLNGLISQAYFSIVQRRMMDIPAMQNALADQIRMFDTASGIPPDERAQIGSMLSRFNDFLGSIAALDSTESTNSGGSDTAASRSSDSSDDFSPFRPPDIQFTEAVVTSLEPRTSWEITFPQSVQWGLLGVAASFAMSLVVEHTRGTYLRLRLAPISRAHILAGKGLACFIASVSICALLMLVGILVFGVRVAWPLGLAIAILSAGVCFTGIMMLISVMGRTEQAVGGAGWAILLIMAMTGGGMVPLIAMPRWMLSIGAFSPVRWSVTALEGAIWRGFTAAQMVTPVAILLGTGVACFALGVFILARRDR